MEKLKIDTIEQARAIVEKAGIIPVKNEPVNVFVCGHVIAHCDDAVKTSSGYRICGQCRAKFLIKYKICECGVESIGKRVGKGTCQKCTNIRNNQKAQIRKAQNYVPRPKKEPREYVYIPDTSYTTNHNRRQASMDRIDCEKRMTCLDEKKDERYKYLDCWKCTKYSPACFNGDAMAGRGRICESVVGL